MARVEILCEICDAPLHKVAATRIGAGGISFDHPMRTIFFECSYSTQHVHSVEELDGRFRYEDIMPYPHHSLEQIKRLAPECSGTIPKDAK